MLVVISPAKRLDWGLVPGVAAREPEFAGEAAALAGVARGLSEAALAGLMDLSPALARLNVARFRAFADVPGAEAVRPAAFAFAGDTYAGLEARSLSEDALRWAEGHLRILSGLYGLLGPLDGIQPYRLEMGSRLANPRGRDLYAWWGDRIARALNAAAEAAGTGWVVNCASREYFGAVDLGVLVPEVVTPVFLEDRPGGPKVVSFYAKKARGAMARFVMEARLAAPEDLCGFDAGGYAHAPELSAPGRPVFLRRG